jgi:hypothetical protein
MRVKVPLQRAKNLSVLPGGIVMIHVPFNDPAPDRRKTPDHFNPGDRVMALGHFGKAIDTLGTVEEAEEMSRSCGTITFA